MSKKEVEPDELRMPSDEFDEMMRRALGVPSPPVQPKLPKATKVPKPD